MAAAKKTYKVTAPLVTARTKADRLVYLFKGDVITEDITSESVDHLKGLGFLAEDDGPEPGDVVKAEAEAASEPKARRGRKPAAQTASDPGASALEPEVEPQPEAEAK